MPADLGKMPLYGVCTFFLRKWKEYGKIKQNKKKWTGIYVRCLFIGNEWDDAAAGAVADRAYDALKREQFAD